MRKAASKKAASKKAAKIGGSVKCILLCAGYATRLYPLTRDKPKALLNVKGKPVLEHILEKINDVPEIDEVLLVTNKKFYDCFVEWARGKKFRKPVRILDDGSTGNEDRLGAIGDISFVVDREGIDEDVFVVAGDNLFKFNLLELFERYREKKGSLIALYDVGSKEEAKKFGVVELDGGDRVVDFQEKPPQPKSTLASVGLYLYHRETLRMVRKYLEEGNSPDKPGSFLEWLHRLQEVRGHVFREKWFDIGSFESLEQANKEW